VIDAAGNAVGAARRYYRVPERDAKKWKRESKTGTLSEMAMRGTGGETVQKQEVI